MKKFVALKLALQLKLLLEKHQMSECGRDQIFTGMNKVQFYAAFLLSASGIFELNFPFKSCEYYLCTITLQLFNYGSKTTDPVGTTLEHVFELTRKMSVLNSSLTEVFEPYFEHILI